MFFMMFFLMDSDNIHHNYLIVLFVHVGIVHFRCWYTMCCVCLGTTRDSHKASFFEAT